VIVVLTNIFKARKLLRHDKKRNYRTDLLLRQEAIYQLQHVCGASLGINATNPVVMDVDDFGGLVCRHG